MRTVFREATILGREPDGPLDIVVDDGRIADIGKTIAAAGEEIRLGGKLATPGMVETHIHLDKACILDRCAPEPETGPTEHAARVTAAKENFTVEDVRARASRTLEKCILNGATRTTGGSHAASCRYRCCSDCAARHGSVSHGTRPGLRRAAGGSGCAPADSPRCLTCTLSSNKILNPFTPFGDGSLIRMANIYANIAQASKPAEIRHCFEMASTQSAKLLRQDDFGIAVGNPADIVVFEAASPEQAVAEVIAPEAGFKAGRRTFTRPAGELHRPG